jgi:hypothetical protein
MAGVKSKECREKVALALASGASVEEAAASAGVCERQVFRWLSEDTAFNQLLASIHEEMLDQSMSLLVEAQRHAARRLLKLLGDRNKRIALGAVKVALEWQDRLTERVQQRLEDLHEMMADEEAKDPAGSGAAKDAQQFARDRELMEKLMRATKNGKG